MTIITIEQLTQLEKAMMAVFAFFKQNAQGSAFLLDVCGLSGNTAEQAREQQRIAGIQLFGAVRFQAQAADTDPAWQICQLRRVIPQQCFKWMDTLTDEYRETLIVGSVRRIGKQERATTKMPAFSF